MGAFLCRFKSHTEWRKGGKRAHARGKYIASRLSTSLQVNDVFIERSPQMKGATGVGILFLHGGVRVRTGGEVTLFTRVFKRARKEPVGRKAGKMGQTRSKDAMSTDPRQIPNTSLLKSGGGMQKSRQRLQIKNRKTPFSHFAKLSVGTRAKSYFLS